MMDDNVQGEKRGEKRDEQEGGMREENTLRGDETRG
jgi:hypothetical protein